MSAEEEQKKNRDTLTNFGAEHTEQNLAIIADLRKRFTRISRVAWGQAKASVVQSSSERVPFLKVPKSTGADEDQKISPYVVTDEELEAFTLPPTWDPEHFFLVKASILHAEDKKSIKKLGVDWTFVDLSVSLNRTTKEAAPSKLERGKLPEPAEAEEEKTPQVALPEGTAPKEEAPQEKEPPPQGGGADGHATGGNEPAPAREAAPRVRPRDLLRHKSGELDVAEEMMHYNKGVEECLKHNLITSVDALDPTVVKWLSRFRLKYEGLKKAASEEGSNDVCMVHEQAGAGRKEVKLSRTEASRVLGASDDSVPGSSNKVAAAFHAAVRKGNLAPIAEGTYLRSIFRHEASGITAILDEDVRMSRIERWDGPTSGAADFFPYSLLSIHTDPGKSSKEAPKWLSVIYDCANLFQVSGFSKAAHMVGNFRAQACGLPLPHWQSRIANCADQSHEPAGIAEGEVAPGAVLGYAPPLQERRVSLDESQPLVDRKKTANRALLHSFNTSPEEKDMLDISSGAAADIVAVPAGAAGGLGAPLLARPEGGGAGAAPEQRGWLPFSRAGAKPVRKAIVAVQPKTLNSLERTYLEWVHFVTLLATVGVFLMHAGNERGIGRVLVLVSITLIARVHYVFTWRAEALDLKKDIEYHDPVTPILLVAGIIVCVSWSSLGAIGAIDFNT
ncbi:unnamed protein product [Prorocentrum cordatum]|uniref:VTC domain-containing protein n=1 Tax=Prorocentrum cordatum TaxID=2364126 RepID=A0ABN9SAZ0_9DINO|nr:unnamed protein product [Polarella glacialis]